MAFSKACVWDAAAREAAAEKFTEVLYRGLQSLVPVEPRDAAASLLKEHGDEEFPCCGGMLQGLALLLSSSWHASHRAPRRASAPPCPQLSLGDKLQEILTEELRKHSRETWETSNSEPQEQDHLNERLDRCSVAGAAGPILAILLGLAHGCELEADLLLKLRATLRSELRRLARKLADSSATQSSGNPPSSETGSPLTPNRRCFSACLAPSQASHLDEFEVILTWCSSSSLPSYSVGVSLAREGVTKKQVLQTARYAWNLRAITHRRRVNLDKDAPLLAAVCDALCGLGRSQNPEEKLLALLRGLNKRRRQITFGSVDFRS